MRRRSVGAATCRRLGLDEGAESPFRRTREWAVRRAVDRARLDDAARVVAGEHALRAFAVRGTAPPGDDHRCHVTRCEWRDRDGGVVLEIQANRFLHHMVRFLVGTMLDVATGRRPQTDVARLLAASDNAEVSPPAPPHGLFLDAVEYPSTLYL